MTLKKSTLPYLLTGAELSLVQLESVLALALAQKAKPADYQQTLVGKSIATVFEKPSLRTRVSFAVGMQKLGGQALYLDEQTPGLGQRESLADYAKNLSCWCDAIVARVLKHQTLQILAEHATVPVINSLCDQFHPCQALADCLTLTEQFGGLNGLHIVYAGDGNNVTRSLMLYAAMLGAHVTSVTPPDATVDSKWLDYVNANSAGKVANANDFNGLAPVDVIYTDTWVSMGDNTPLDQVKARFLPYQINKQLIESLSPQAVMHCQPVHRGYEITSEIIDSDLSLCLQQAENRLYAQNALLSLMLADASELNQTELLRNAS